MACVNKKIPFFFVFFENSATATDGENLIDKKNEN